MGPIVQYYATGSDRSNSVSISCRSAFYVCFMYHFFQLVFFLVALWSIRNCCYWWHWSRSCTASGCVGIGIWTASPFVSMESPRLLELVWSCEHTQRLPSLQAGLCSLPQHEFHVLSKPGWHNHDGRWSQSRSRGGEDDDFAFFLKCWLACIAAFRVRIVRFWITVCFLMMFVVGKICFWEIWWYGLQDWCRAWECFAIAVIYWESGRILLNCDHVKSWSWSFSWFVIIHQYNARHFLEVRVVMYALIPFNQTSNLLTKLF